MKKNINRIKGLYKDFNNILEKSEFSNDFVNKSLDIGVEISEKIRKIFEEKGIENKYSEDEQIKIIKRLISLYKIKGLNILTIDELENKIIDKLLGKCIEKKILLGFDIFPVIDGCKIIEGEGNLKGKTEFNKEPVIVDKFGVLLKVLLKEDVDWGDIVIYEEELDKKRMRKIPYDLIYLRINGKNKTIVTSDVIGQATFVYHGLIKLEKFASYSKGEEIDGKYFNKVEYSKYYFDDLSKAILEEELELREEDSEKVNIDKKILDKFGLKQILYYRSKLESYKERLKEESNISFEDDIWYFGDAKGYPSWTYLKNFPNSRFNKENKIGSCNGNITSVKDLKKMFKALGLKVATKKQEKVRWRKYIESLEDELKDKANIHKEGKIWYFGDAKGMDNWKKLVNFPNGKFNKENGIGNERGAIQKSDQLKKMFEILGLKVATQEQEKARWGKILESYENRLREESNIYKEEGFWCFGDVKRTGRWSYIQYFPNAKFNRENRIGNKDGVIKKVEDLKKIFSILGQEIATEEQEKVRWGKKLESYEVRLREKSNIYFEEGIWYFGDAKGNGTWNYIQHFPNSKFNRENRIGNKDGVILNPVQLKKMFKVLGSRVATEEEEKIRWGKYMESLEDELREKANIYKEDEIWYFGEAKACGTWKKLQSFPNGSFNRDNKIGDDKGIIQNPVQLKKMFRVLGLRVATKKEEEKRKNKKRVNF